MRMLRAAILVAAVLAWTSAHAQIDVAPLGANGGSNSGGGGGSGTVTNIATACSISGGPITTTGTIQATANPTTEVGTNYAFLAADMCTTVYLNNASNQIPTIPQAGTAGFESGKFIEVCNIGAGTQTITPTTSTIGGASTYVLLAGSAAAPKCIGVISNGTNYLLDQAPNLAAGATAANPSATASDTANNGSAVTFMRSDASPAVQKGSNAQFGLAEGDGTSISMAAGVAQRSALTGDVTASAGSAATTIATVNPNVGSFTSANITVNGKGQVTAAANGSGGGSPGGSTTQVQYNLSGAFAGDAGMVYAGLGQLTLALGTITTSANAAVTVTWNAAGITFAAPFKATITNTASAVASKMWDWRITSGAGFDMRKDGLLGLYGSTGTGLPLMVVPSATGNYPAGGPFLTDYDFTGVFNSGNGTNWYKSGALNFIAPFGSTGGFNWKAKFDPNNTTVSFSSDVPIKWNSTTDLLSGSIDTGLTRNAAAVVEANNGTAGTLREFIARSYVAGGSTPSNSGSCAINTQLGGNTAGSFKANGICTAGTVILTFGFTAANGWACDAHDLTTTADNLNQTAYSTTTATFTGTMASADLVTFKCTAF